MSMAQLNLMDKVERLLSETVAYNFSDWRPIETYGQVVV